MRKVRELLARLVELLRRLGRLLLPAPPEWGWAPPALDQRSDGPGWSLAQSLMIAGAAALAVADLSGGWRIFPAVLLVVAVGQAVFFAVRIARRRWRRGSADDHGIREAESGRLE